MPSPRFSQVTVARAAPGRLAHFPDVVRLPDGRLLAAYREGAGHVSHEGRICVVDGDDGGRTWSAPRIAVDGPYDDRDPKLGLTTDGAVLLSYFMIDWSTRPRHTVLGTYVRRSEDGGRTWSEPAPVGTRLGWAASHGGAVPLAGGDLLLPLYGASAPGQRQRATVVRSIDGGKTWPVEAEVPLAEADGVHLQEPILTVLDTGEVVALIRTTGERAYLARSGDGGRSWTPPRATDMPASSHHALALSTGEVLVTYGDLSRRFSPHRETVGRLVREPAKAWDGYADVQIYDSGHRDQANPSSVEIAPGEYVTLGFDVTAATVVGVFTGRDDYPAG